MNSFRDGSGWTLWSLRRSVVEHLTKTGQAISNTPEESTAWITQARESLLHEGWPGIDMLTRPLASPAGLTSEVPRSAAHQAALDELRNDLSPHADHLHYAERLNEGRSIGSGQIEGACKNLIGRRLKANASRCRVRRVNRMAGLCCLLDSDQWAPDWQTP